ncbi:MAG: hypothetical protein C0501_20065 [Isosphaera sp.]|nr:hypothetical protein [Isosphaera sp.]
MLRYAPFAGAVLLLVTCGAPARAAFIQNTTGIASPAATITFSEVDLPTDTPLTDQFAAFGVTFSNLLYNPQPLILIPNQTAPNAGNFPSTFGPAIGNPITIVFTTNQTAAAFSLATNTGTTTFTALLDGSVVETATAPTVFLSANNFFGFTGITFDEIQVTPGGNGNVGLIDNIQLSQAPPPAAAPVTAPEPAALTLLGIGAAGLVGRLRRRRTVAVS